MRTTIFIRKTPNYAAVGVVLRHEAWWASLIGCCDNCQRHMLQRSDER